MKKDHVTVAFRSFAQSVEKALDGLGAREPLSGQSTILIKPNLTTVSPHPVTTSPECCEAVIEYVRRHSKARIVIAEGCGDARYETGEVFESLGYTEMARRQGVSLVDLNHGPVREVRNPGCAVFPKMYLPEVAFTHYIVSVPVLKAHSLAGLTGSLKNMMGFAQPRYYAGRHGVWKKALFHERMQESVTDLNTFLVPDLSVMDCSVGLAEFHLGGPPCDPPLRKMIAGYNPWEVDRQGAELLGLSWKAIGHVAAGFRRGPAPPR